MTTSQKTGSTHGMTENLQLKKLAGQYASGDISESEFIRRMLDELAYQHSTSFWCKVIELREKHNYATEPIEK